MLVGNIAALAALISTVAGVPAPSVPHVLHERQDVSPVQWVNRGPVASGTEVPVRIGLTQSNLEEGHDLLMDLSVSLLQFIGREADSCLRIRNLLG